MRHLIPTLFQASLLPIKLLFQYSKRLQIEGIENLKKGPYIFASNHIGELDSIFIGLSLPSTYRPLYAVSQNKGHYSDFGWKQHIYGGRLFEMIGAYPVNKGCKDYSISLSKHVDLIKNGKNMLIFPEGRWRDYPSQKLEAKGGVGYLSKETKSPVVPVYIEGLSDFNIRVIFGKPIYSDELSNDCKKSAGQIMNHINILGSVNNEK